jgi:hypothetical protein
MLTQLRKFVCYIFGLEALILLAMFPVALVALQRYGYHDPRIHIIRFLAVPAFFTLLGVVFTVAWWCVKTSRCSSRAWGMGASGLNILLSLPILFSSHIKFGGFLWLLPLSGMVGAYLFFSQPKPTTAAAPARKIRPIPGDGTHVLINPLPWLVGTVGGIAGYF